MIKLKRSEILRIRIIFFYRNESDENIMRQITLDDVFTVLESKRDSNLVVIVNAYVLDTVYCIDEFQYEILEEPHGRTLKLQSKNGEKSYYDYHGVYISLKDIVKISTTEDTIYIYLENQLVKLKFK